MLSRQEKEAHKEILDALTVASDIMNVKLLDTELRQMATRLLRFHGRPLFDLITKIPEGRYFPPIYAIENDARRALGLPTVGLTAELIEKNERECVVGGQDPAKAKAGAELMRSTLRRNEVIDPEALLNAGAMRVEWDQEEGVKTTLVPAQEMVIETWEDSPEEKPKKGFDFVPEEF